MKDLLIAVGVIFSIIGAILVFRSGDTFSIILEIIGIALSVVGFFIEKKR